MRSRRVLENVGACRSQDEAVTIYSHQMTNCNRYRFQVPPSADLAGYLILDTLRRLNVLKMYLWVPVGNELVVQARCDDTTRRPSARDMEPYYHY